MTSSALVLKFFFRNFSENIFRSFSRNFIKSPCGNSFRPSSRIFFSRVPLDVPSKVPLRTLSLAYMEITSADSPKIPSVIFLEIRSEVPPDIPS